MIKHVANSEFPSIIEGWIFQHILASLDLLPKDFLEPADYEGGYN